MPAAPWSIRPAHAADYRAMRLLLPSAIHFGSTVRAWTACDADKQIIGAAAMAQQFRTRPVPGPRVTLEVPPPWRHHGVESALIQTIAAAAARRGASALYGWDTIEIDGPERAAFKSLGFDHDVEVEEASGEIAPVMPQLQRLYDGIIERGWIPADASIVNLPDADATQIAELHVSCLGSNVDEVIRQIRGQTLVNYHPLLSPVLRIGNRVVGFTLAEVLPSRPHMVRVHATVVHPTLRNGWANLWLKYHGGRRCQELGITTLIEQSYAHHSDTRRLSRQWRGQIRRLTEPYRLLTPQAPPRPRGD